MPPQYSARLRRVLPKVDNRIRPYRLQAGLTQLEVARSLGIRLTTVSSWERGQTCPTGPMLLRLAKVLDTLAEALYPQFYLRVEAEGTVEPSA
jgi:transcriptional regulator with XRE-family HTH domain